MKKKIIYIAHPISGDVEANIKSVYGIISDIARSEPDVVPIAPYTAYLHALEEDNPAQREQGINFNLNIIASGGVHELRTYGAKLSRGMLIEVQHAMKCGVPVVDCSGNSLPIPCAEMACNACGWVGSKEELRYEDYPAETLTACPICSASSASGSLMEINPLIGGDLTVEECRPRTFRLQDSQHNIVRITIEPDPNNPTGGYLAINGDFGDYSYYWGAMRKGGVLPFLKQVNMEYMAGKFGKSRYFDLKSTIEEMKRVVMETREEKQKKEVALKVIENIRQETEEFGEDSITYNGIFWDNHHIISDFFDTPDTYYTIDPKFKRFWEKMWRPFILYLNKKYANKPF